MIDRSPHIIVTVVFVRMIEVTEEGERVIHSIQVGDVSAIHGWVAIDRFAIVGMVSTLIGDQLQSFSRGPRFLVFGFLNHFCDRRIQFAPDSAVIAG